MASAKCTTDWDVVKAHGAGPRFGRHYHIRGGIQCIADVCGDSPEQAERRAVLMAAAPAMLEALESIASLAVADYPPSLRFADIQFAAHAAIVLAKGGAA